MRLSRVPSHRAIVLAFAAPIVALLVLTLAGCPQRREPPPVTPGVVTDVEQIPGRRADSITVRYRNGFIGSYRVPRGACSVDERYPDCVAGRAQR